MQVYAAVGNAQLFCHSLRPPPHGWHGTHTAIVHHVDGPPGVFGFSLSWPRSPGPWSSRNYPLPEQEWAHDVLCTEVGPRVGT